MEALEKVKAFPIKLKNWLARIQRDLDKPLHLRLKEQANQFSELGLTESRDSLLDYLDTVLSEAGLPPYDESIGMYSEHLIAFAAVAKSTRYNPTRILEIGTYDGKTSVVLSRLFPRASITTIDLEDNDPIFIGSYGRDSKERLERFISKRNANLKRCENVHAVQHNSLWLSRQRDQEYDLIWLDGAHGYPVACCDITNAVRMLAENGILLCDDVFMDSRSSDSLYKSNASWETLREFSSAGILKLVLLRKRLGFQHLSQEKYIACSYLNKVFRDA